MQGPGYSAMKRKYQAGEKLQLFFISLLQLDDHLNPPVLLPAFL